MQQEHRHSFSSFWAGASKICRLWPNWGILMQRALSVPIWLSAHVPAVPRLWDTCKHNEGTSEKTIHLGLLNFVASLNVFYLWWRLQIVADVLQTYKRQSSEFVYTRMKGLRTDFFSWEFVWKLKAGSSKPSSHQTLQIWSKSRSGRLCSIPGYMVGSVYCLGNMCHTL